MADTKQDIFPVVHWFPGHMAKAHPHDKGICTKK